MPRLSGFANMLSLALFGACGSAADGGGDARALPTGLSAAITAASADGSLCPADSYVAQISADRHALTLTFSAAELQSSETESLAGSCSVQLELQVPPGVQFRSLDVYASGYVFAERGSASLDVDYNFPNSGVQQRFAHSDLHGDTSYVFADVSDMAWSPSCASGSDRSLILSLEFHVKAAGEAYVNLDALDLDFSQGDVQWRACSAAHQGVSLNTRGLLGYTR